MDKLADLLFLRPDDRRVVVTGASSEEKQGSQLPDTGEVTDRAEIVNGHQ
jgi:hypothetical protein